MKEASHLFASYRIGRTEVSRTASLGDAPGVEPLDIGSQGIVRCDVDKSSGGLASDGYQGQNQGDRAISFKPGRLLFGAVPYSHVEDIDPSD